MDHLQAIRIFARVVETGGFVDRQRHHHSRIAGLLCAIPRDSGATERH